MTQTNLAGPIHLSLPGPVPNNASLQQCRLALSSVRLVPQLSPAGPAGAEAALAIVSGARACGSRAYPCGWREAISTEQWAC